MEIFHEKIYKQFIQVPINLKINYFIYLIKLKERQI